MPVGKGSLDRVAKSVAKETPAEPVAPVTPESKAPKAAAVKGKVSTQKTYAVGDPLPEYLL